MALCVAECHMCHCHSAFQNAIVHFRMHCAHIVLLARVVGRSLPCCVCEPRNAMHIGVVREAGGREKN